ncbi:MAG TPA: sulfatase [Polyangiaceae bacterium]|nr:sulfatase [Polyangiaceae bacterium]
MISPKEHCVPALGGLSKFWPAVSRYLGRAASAAGMLTIFEQLAFAFSAHLGSDLQSRCALVHATFAAYFLCACVGVAVAAGLTRLARRFTFDAQLAAMIALGALLAAGVLHRFDLWAEHFNFNEFPQRVAWAVGAARAGLIALVFFGFQLSWRALAPRLTARVPAAALCGAFWVAACLGCYFLIYETLVATHIGPLIIPVALSAVLAACWATAQLPVIAGRVGAVLGNAALLFALAAPVTSFRNAYARFAFVGHCPVVSYLMVPVVLAVDVDADGSGPVWLGGEDCDNLDSGRGPLQREIPADGIDQDCRGGDAPEPAPDPALVDRATLLTELGPCTMPQGTAEAPLSVVLLTVDALRADVVSPRLTPNIFKFSQSALNFRHAYAPSTNTKRSFAAMFAGRTVSDFSLANVFGQEDLDIGQPWSAKFAQAGYYTTGINLLYTIAPVRNSFRRFNVLPNNDFQEHDAKSTIASATMTQAVLGQFQKGIKAPFLLWAHYPDLHAPYRNTTSAPQLSPELQGYEREAAYTDLHLGHLLQAFENADLYAHAMVVISADHGEELGQRGIEGHGPFAFESVVHVPLLMRVPGCAPKEFEHPVSTVDLFANLATLAGISPRARSLAASGERGRAVVSEVWPADPTNFLRVVVDGTLKMIVEVRSGGRVLFDLASDPGERHDLYGSRPDLAARLERRYQSWLDRPGAR